MYAIDQRDATTMVAPFRKESRVVKTRRMDPKFPGRITLGSSRIAQECRRGQFERTE